MIHRLDRTEHWNQDMESVLASGDQYVEVPRFLEETKK